MQILFSLVSMGPIDKWFIGLGIDLALNMYFIVWSCGSLSQWKLSHHDTNFVVTGATSDDKVGIMMTLIFEWW